MGYGTPQEIIDNYTLQECYETGFYKTALGNVIKVPDNFTDQHYIYKAIIKRFRKDQRNIEINDKNIIIGANK